MRRMTVDSERGPYEVIAEAGAVTRLGAVVDEEGVERPRSVVSDTTVGPLWGEPAARSLGSVLIELDDGEVHKRWSSVENVLAHWLDGGLHRGDSVLAVGGGVITDTVGFAAAIFLRGVSWVAVPTTLLAMVDAAVGGKTGINLEQGKNLAGAFWPPRLVVIDVETLATLPERELRAGMAEVVKTAWIGDRELLKLIRLEWPADQSSQRAVAWEEIVMRCLTVKARVVSDDEREVGKRAALNLGHTLGHALEAATGYRHFLHGEAVAWGLLAAARLGRRHGLLGADGEGAIAAAVSALQPLPAIAGIDADAVRAHIGLDKKKDHAGVRWVLPTDDGVALDQRVPADEVVEVFRELKELSIS